MTFDDGKVMKQSKGLATKDHYTIDVTNQYSGKILERERISLELMANAHPTSKTRLVDAGCAKGKLLIEIWNRFGIKGIGLEYSKTFLAEARTAGVDARFCDLHAGIPLEDATVDILNASEVIEHLYDPDFFLREANRVLAKGGSLVISTPNLCAWFNRILLLFGIQPLFLESSTEDRSIGAGPLRKMKKSTQVVGHVRILHVTALKDLLERHGFEVKEIHGTVFENELPAPASWIDRLMTIRTGLSALLVVRAVKKREL